ncbi:hypothetical protein KC217_19790, partial [Mycobacterium tuberculosis]|nr:hypothetical protein [Mycobacterium tuberculosis]
ERVRGRGAAWSVGPGRLAAMCDIGGSVTQRRSERYVCRRADGLGRRRGWRVPRAAAIARRATADAPDS